jgi:GT2 family glycosyltransferase/glycosyltransferase involved in cell wall biosynthesis
LPIIDWFFRYQRPQQLLTQFAAKGYRIFYLDPSLDGRPYAKSGSVSDRWTLPLTHNVTGIKLPTKLDSNIYSGSLKPTAIERLAQDFQDIACHMGIGEATLFVELPFWTPLALRLRRDLGLGLIYDCLDDHAGFGNISADILAHEAELVHHADLVVASSSALFEKVRGEACHAVLAPNGCDYAHFAQAEPALADLPRPVIGYYGAIADWFAPELVAAAACARPDASFALIGRASPENRLALQHLRNVHFLGERDYAVLPQYLSAFDVSLIPFRHNALTAATNPVKLFEYLAGGKPVVSTRLPEVERYAEVVHFGDTPAEFVAAIETALAEGPAKAEARRAVGRANEWSARVHTIDAAVRHSQPRASIVLVTWNNWNYTQACLESIYHFTAPGQFEVIVVDNASTDGTRLRLHGYQCQHDNLRVVFNDQNRGFAAANNQGLRLATGSILVLLNNDTIVTPGWLRGLARWLQDPHIGLVGPVTNRIANEACIPADYRDLPGLLRTATQVRRAGAGKCFDIGMLAMFCVAFRRDLFDRVGELDERFEAGMFEDDDYALRVRHAGLRLVCARDVFVHHFGSASFNKLGRREYRRLFDRNRAQFESKWGQPWVQPLMRSPRPPVAA